MRQPCAAEDSDPILADLLARWPNLTPGARPSVGRGVRDAVAPLDQTCVTAVDRCQLYVRSPDRAGQRMPAVMAPALPHPTA